MALSQSQLNWLSSLSGGANSAGASAGVSPSLVLGQAALESGFGQSSLASNYNNLFGVKGTGDAGSVMLPTRESINGQMVTVNQQFARYSSQDASLAAYSNLLTSNPRYSKVLSAGDLTGEVTAMGASGYATDPNYTSKLTGIINSIDKSGTLNAAGTKLASTASNLISKGMTVARIAAEAAIPGVGPIIAAADVLGVGGGKSWVQQIIDWFKNGHFFERLALGVVALIFIFAAFYLLGAGNTTINSAVKAAAL